MNLVYILQLRDKTLYTGHTSNLKRRLKEHERGKGSKYVKGRRPFELVYVEEHDSRADAMRREQQIKKLSREEKKCILFNDNGKILDRIGWIEPTGAA
jgi:putative endonuclease